MLKLFVYNNESSSVEIHEPDVLLIREFATLYNRDKTELKTRAMREFKFIYLEIDWISPYAQFLPKERMIEARQDAELSKEEFDDPDFRAACRKYRAIQSESIIGSFLEESRNVLRKLKEKYKNMQLEERNDSGAYITSSLNLLKELQSIETTVDSLKKLEASYYKEQQDVNKLRGSGEPGLFDY